MRTITRGLLVAAASAPLMLLTPAFASAAESTDVTFAFAVDGQSVTNTVTNNSGGTLFCGTSLAPAPGGVLPPVAEVIQNGQSLYTNGDVQSGSTTQTVVDVPAGSYVALASCTSDEGGVTTAWVSDYPGIDETLAQLPWTSYVVQEASPVLTVTEPAPGLFPDLAELLGSGSAG